MSHRKIGISPDVDLFCNGLNLDPSGSKDIFAEYDFSRP